MEGAIRSYRPSPLVVGSAVLAGVALQPTVSPIPLTLLLAGLIVQSSQIVTGVSARPNQFLSLLFSVSFGSFLARVGPFLHALSAPATSVVVLVGGSIASLLLPLVPATLYALALSARPTAPQSERLLSLFPAIWTT